MSYATPPHPSEFDPPAATTVTLSAEAIAWAVAVCQRVAAGDQWATFLRAMALRGVQQWLGEGTGAIALDLDLNQPPLAATVVSASGLRLAVVAQGSLSDTVVPLPQTLVDGPEFAHLVVLAEVREETDQVTVLAGLRRDRLRTLGLTPAADGTLTVPIEAFDTDPDALLLYLACLHPRHLETPVPAVEAAPLRSPQLSPLARLGSAAWGGELINAGRWLRDQLDTVADTLAWTLLPPLAPASAIRSTLRTPAEDLEAVLRELAAAGVAVPPTARGAYTDLQPLGLSLRLYALTWTLFEAPSPEWSLFLFLGPVAGQPLPPGTRLILRDATATLADQTLSADNPAAHLYAQAIGTWDEQFTATVQLPNGTTLHWPPFAFQPDL